MFVQGKWTFNLLTNGNDVGNELSRTEVIGEEDISHTLVTVNWNLYYDPYKHQMGDVDSGIKELSTCESSLPAGILRYVVFASDLFLPV